MNMAFKEDTENICVNRIENKELKKDADGGYSPWAWWLRVR